MAGVKPKNEVSVTTFIECLFAVHLSSYVTGAWKERSGLMIVGPPAVLKSTLLSLVPAHFPNAVELSDVNVPSLVDLRDQMASSVIRTLVVPDLGKLYERHPSTAGNLEGHLRALTGEGFSAASFEDSRMNRLVARATLLSAMVPETQGDHFKRWENTGWNRRFLWSLLSLKDPDELIKAVIRWKPLRFGDFTGAVPETVHMIENTTTIRQRRFLATVLRWQPGGAHSTQLSMLVRMLAVLNWLHKHRRIRGKPFAKLLIFCRSLQKGGALLTFPRQHG